MKYTKLFETTAQYNAYTADTANFIKPNVSVAKDAPSTVYLNQKNKSQDGHEYVEIAGLKWSTMNLGATGLTDYGLYYQWGDTQGYTSGQCGSESGQKYFGWEDYKHWTGNTGSGDSGFTKYNETDDKRVLEPSDDAAQASWGGNWRIPTAEEFAAFGLAVNTAWTYNYNETGVGGLICTDKTDSSKVVFLPAGGFCASGKYKLDGPKCCYWSSSMKSIYVEYANEIDADYTNIYWQNSVSLRLNGFNIRPVSD